MENKKTETWVADGSDPSLMRGSVVHKGKILGHVGLDAFGWRHSKFGKGLEPGAHPTQQGAVSALVKKSTQVSEHFKPHSSVEDIAKKHNVSVADIGKQLDMGINVEQEHTKDKSIATVIALQHLDELPDYYTRLKGAEKMNESTMKKLIPTINKLKKKIVLTGNIHAINHINQAAIHAKKGNTLRSALHAIMAARSHKIYDVSDKKLK